LQKLAAGNLVKCHGVVLCGDPGSVPKREGAIKPWNESDFANGVPEAEGDAAPGTALNYWLFFRKAALCGVQLPNL
jgi:hypothetical protein